MRPKIALDVATLRANVRAWTTFAGVPVRAVVKSEGYGWGFAALAEALEDLVEAFIVADAEEFAALRPLTRRPIVTLSDARAEQMPRLLDEGALPNVVSEEGIEAAAAWARERGRSARIRVGLRPALGWTGFEPEGLLAQVRRLAQPELEIEYWTHLTHPTLMAAQRERFVEVERALRKGGVRIVATDIESSAPLALAGKSAGSHVRLGAALFGSRGEGGPPDVRCALRVEAPVVQRFPALGQTLGYTTLRAPEHGHLHLVRCGYGDGFPRLTGGICAGVLSVGMQYAVVWRGEVSEQEGLALVDADSDLDEIARAASVTPHEIVVRLGLGARARSFMESNLF